VVAPGRTGNTNRATTRSPASASRRSVQRVGRRLDQQAKGGTGSSSLPLPATPPLATTASPQPEFALHGGGRHGNPPLVQGEGPVEGFGVDRLALGQPGPGRRRKHGQRLEGGQVALPHAGFLGQFILGLGDAIPQGVELQAPLVYRRQLRVQQLLPQDGHGGGQATRASPTSSAISRAWPGASSKRTEMPTTALGS